MIYAHQDQLSLRLPKVMLWTTPPPALVAPPYCLSWECYWGVYSIVNAVRAICPEVDTATAEHLFDLLMQRLLRTVGNPSTAVTW